MELGNFYKSFDPSLPEPIAFNGWKHHLGFIQQSVKSIGAKVESQKILLLSNSIGGSVLDLYTGFLNPICIANEVKSLLHYEGVDSIDIFRDWLGQNHDEYRVVSLSDTSTWTLRLGRFKNRYVHVHPARYSASSLRVKPTALKTAIAYCLSNLLTNNSSTVDELNRVRTNIISLSPLKKGRTYPAILNLIELLDI